VLGQDSTVDDSDVSQSQDSYVEATFVDSVVHNVARHPSFGDSDGYDFDITYKAHVSTGILSFEAFINLFLLFGIFS
jgi:hypothetical protein